MNGLLWVQTGSRKAPVTLGLCVENDWVTQGPPYARARGWVGRGRLAVQAELDELHARVLWLPDLPAPVTAPAPATLR